MANSTTRLMGDEGFPNEGIARKLPVGLKRPHLVSKRVEGVGPAAKRPLVWMPHETEDSVITGGTRSLVRRLLALNLAGTLRGTNLRGAALRGAGLREAEVRAAMRVEPSVLPLPDPKIA